MIHKNIPIDQTGLYSKLVLDYISEKEVVKPYYQYAPRMGEFERIISNKDFGQEKRDLLVEVLSQQYLALGIAESKAGKTWANINSLKKSNTFTVTTGHQLALFTGPLFFIFKIVSTIRLAQELKLKYPTNDFVPVFWLASEDHDFAEINHVNIKGQKIEWNINSQNQPVGVLETNQIQNAIDELKKVLGESNELIELFERSYQSSQNLSEATRKIVHQLFADYGLVMIEPNDVGFKRQFTNVMLDDVIEHSSFNALIKTNAELGKKYKLQITGREINFFYLSTEGRNLIKKTPKGYVVNNTNILFSEEEMKSEINSHPERFSPNVVLRPVYQETILPNLAYLGGPGEVAYWLQLKEVFQAHQTFFPMIVLRNSILLVRQSILYKLDKRHITIEQLFQKEDELIKQFIAREHPIDIDEEIQNVNDLLQSIIDKVEPFNNRISSKIIDWKMEAKTKLELIKKELQRSKKEKSEADIELLMSIKHELFPNNEPSERYDTLAQYTGKHYASFIQFIEKSILPLSHTMDVIIYN